MAIEILNMDCVEYMKTLHEEDMDMIITSPPYDDLRDYGGDYTWNWDKQKKVISECARVLSIGGVMVWIVADSVVDGCETGSSFKQALFAIDCGLNLHDTMIWCKDSFSFPESNRYPQCFEYMFVFSKGKPKCFSPIKDRKTKYGGTKIHGTFRQKDGRTTPNHNNGKRIDDNGWRFNYWEKPTTKTSKEHGHPASFPVSLAYDHIISWSEKGSKVYDPFLGSGSSAIAAHIAGVDFVGTEINSYYYKAACERFENETKQETLF